MYTVIETFHDRNLNKVFSSGSTYPHDTVPPDWLQNLSTAGNRIGRPVIKWVEKIETATADISKAKTSATRSKKK